MEERVRGLPIGQKGELHIHEIPQIWGALDQGLLLAGATAEGPGLRGCAKGYPYIHRIYQFAPIMI